MLIFSSIAALLFSAHLGLSATVALGVAAVAAVLLGADILFSLVQVPRVQSRIDELRQQRHALIMWMMSMYDEVPLAGPISVRRVRDRAERSEEEGAVWPKALWPLLDDLEARQVHHL